MIGFRRRMKSRTRGQNEADSQRRVTRLNRVPSCNSIDVTGFPLTCVPFVLFKSSNRQSGGLTSTRK